MKKIIKKQPVWVWISLCFFLVVIGYFIIPEISARNYIKANEKIQKTENIKEITPEVLPTVKTEEENIIVTHKETPKPLKAIYMSSWAASSDTFRKKITDLIDKTELNTVVIDIKDYTGKIAFNVSNPDLQKFGSTENRIRNIKSLIEELHKKNIYVIGRIAVFQDPFFIKARPDLAVKTLSNKNAIWKDRKGMTWIDAGSREFWDYTILIAKESYSIGFDELNFDYIRFPSDGNMKDIYFPISNGKIKKEVMKEFFKYLNEKLVNTDSPRTGMKISGDVFGMVATNNDDLNIGQMLEDTIEYFDYVAPMVYPSHFPNGWNGFKNPANNPYDVIKISMDKAVARTKTAGKDPNKIRPWLQDFNMGATYTKEMVRAQIKATYDAGLDSWMLWDPGNTYTEGALLSN